MLEKEMPSRKKYRKVSKSQHQAHRQHKIVLMITSYIDIRFSKINVICKYSTSIKHGRHAWVKLESMMRDLLLQLLFREMFLRITRDSSVFVTWSFASVEKLSILFSVLTGEAPCLMITSLQWRHSFFSYLKSG